MFEVGQKVKRSGKVVWTVVLVQEEIKILQLVNEENGRRGIAYFHEVKAL